MTSGRSRDAMISHMGAEDTVVCCTPLSWQVRYSRSSLRERGYLGDTHESGPNIQTFEYNIPNVLFINTQKKKLTKNRHEVWPNNIFLDSRYFTLLGLIPFLYRVPR